jgi:hypothetical protein
LRISIQSLNSPSSSGSVSWFSAMNSEITGWAAATRHDRIAARPPAQLRAPRCHHSGASRRGWWECGQAPLGVGAESPLRPTPDHRLTPDPPLTRGASGAPRSAQPGMRRPGCGRSVGTLPGGRTLAGSLHIVAGLPRTALGRAGETIRRVVPPVKLWVHEAPVRIRADPAGTCCGAGDGGPVNGRHRGIERHGGGVRLGP